MTVPQRNSIEEPVPAHCDDEAAQVTPEMQAFRQFKDKCCASGLLNSSNDASTDNHYGIADDATLMYVTW